MMKKDTTKGNTMRDRNITLPTPEMIEAHYASFIHRTLERGFDNAEWRWSNETMLNHATTEMMNKCFDMNHENAKKETGIYYEIDADICMAHTQNLKLILTNIRRGIPPTRI